MRLIAGLFSNLRYDKVGNKCNFIELICKITTIIKTILLARQRLRLKGSLYAIHCRRNTSSEINNNRLNNLLSLFERDAY